MNNDDYDLLDDYDDDEVLMPALNVRLLTELPVHE